MQQDDGFGGDGGPFTVVNFEDEEGGTDGAGWDDSFGFEGFQSGGVMKSVTGPLSADVLSWFWKRNGDTLHCALAFVPWVIQEAYHDSKTCGGTCGLVHKGDGAVVFSNASGFETLSERLASAHNSADQLSQCITNFFTPLIELLEEYRGDVIKFRGSGVVVYFPAVDDTKSAKYTGIVPPHGTYGLPDIGAMATAVLRATACCIEIQKRMNIFDTGVDGVCLCLHMGVGCGAVGVLQVGGVVPPETHVPRFEYVIAGSPIEQSLHAESLVKDGETCLSPQAWSYVQRCVIEGRKLSDEPSYHLVTRIDESKYTFPTIKYAASLLDTREEKRFRLAELSIIRQYTPSFVYKQIECGTLAYVNETRNVSVVAIHSEGLDVTSEEGPQRVQELMEAIQRVCYAHEGAVNKFLIDDTGMLFMLVFGLPPLVHTDDPTRAVLACFDLVRVFQSQELVGRFGVTTSMTYCGICGSEKRMEYTVLGESVNLAYRLMMNAPPSGVLCDEHTSERVTSEVIFDELAPILCTDSQHLTRIFQPTKKDPLATIGVSDKGTIWFPWSNAGAAQKTNVQQLCGVAGWDGIVKVQELLGRRFSKELHEVEQVVTINGASNGVANGPPSNSPFVKGGVIVLDGDKGLGKLELAEHIVLSAAAHFHILPVFGTMGPRPGDSVRLAQELLRSALGVSRLLDPSLPKDDYTALQETVPSDMERHMPFLRAALYDTAPPKDRGRILDASLDVVIAMLEAAVSKAAVNIVMQFQSGTSLFDRTTAADLDTFWGTVTRFSELVESQRATGRKPLVLTILCREARPTNRAVALAENEGTHLKLGGLTDQAIVQYMSNYLDLSESLIPAEFQEFVSKVSLGNPLYIRETIDEMLAASHITLQKSDDGKPVEITVQDLEDIDIAAWQHTSMVAGTVCQLESLDPLESAVLKMSTCFQGPFTLSDIAASQCPAWADATHFDLLIIFNRLRALVSKQIVEEVDMVQGDLFAGERAQRVDSFGSYQYFQTSNLLVRAVGASMVLEHQRRAIKRQALVNRALERDLPERLEALETRRDKEHIPWYYMQACIRMHKSEMETRQQLQAEASKRNTKS
eukprot:TRINITY_DN27861_c0_g1_i1.p1 TRINITY_DN27861_c0_g1~~TRINITY_DN27861_c0_g1_i1.p1  ORF type:complete len:1088 (-),score=235.63 TRINITY_DN27861_c0_g1_i1:188-3451(-)